MLHVLCFTEVHPENASTSIQQAAPSTGMEILCCLIAYAAYILPNVAVLRWGLVNSVIFSVQTQKLKTFAASKVEDIVTNVAPFI
jgi:hypothetical protein